MKKRMLPGVIIVIVQKVYSSPYYENIVVDKSINLIGQDKNTTVIDGKTDHAVYIIADFVKIMSFNIKSEDWTVFADANYTNITNNIISGAYCIAIGFNFGRVIGCIISDNIIYADLGEILTWYSTSNIIISGNIIDNNYVGIYLRYSDNNTISGNTVNKNSDGVDNGDIGMYIYNSHNNTISGNDILNSIIGIRLKVSDNNIVLENNFIGSPDCIFEVGCSGNIFEDNENCDYISDIEPSESSKSTFRGYNLFLLSGILWAVLITYFGILIIVLIIRRKMPNKGKKKIQSEFKIKEKPTDTKLKFEN